MHTIFLWRGINKVHYGLSRNGELIIDKKERIVKLINPEHHKYLWNAIVFARNKPIRHEITKPQTATVINLLF